MLRPLVIDNNVRLAAQAVVDYAALHAHTCHDLMAVIKGTRQPAGDDRRHVLEIPVGYRVVYSIEQQAAPLGWCHHLSVSIPVAGRAPSIEAVNEIGKLFGMDLRLPQCDPDRLHVYMEDGTESVNVVLKHGRL